MADKLGEARVEVVGDVSKFARQTEADLKAALAGMKTEKVKIKTEVETDKNQIKTNFAKVGAEAASEVTDKIGKGMSGLSGILGSNPYVTAAGVILGGALAAAALPAIGAALSGAIIAGGGLGVIGLGAWLLREQPALKKAAKKLSDTVKKTFTDAAKPMLGPLVSALKTFQSLIKDITPAIKTAFSTIAKSGAIEALAKGLADLVRTALPGFLDLIKQSGPLLKSLGESLPIIGLALSEFFSSIAEGGPGAQVFFKDLITFIGGTIIMLGDFIGWLSSVYPKVRQFFIDAAAWIASAIVWVKNFGLSVAAAFQTVKQWFTDAVAWVRNLVNAIITGLQPLIAIVTGVWQTISAVVSTVWSQITNVVTTAINLVRNIIRTVSRALAGDWNGTWAGIKATVSTVINGIRTFVQNGLNGIRNIATAFLSTLRASWSAAWSAIRATVSSAISAAKSVISGGVSAMKSAWSAGWSAMISTVKSRISTIVSAIRGLRSTAIGAFSSAGSWLASAGRRIIDGLISGIRAGFGRVRSLLGELTSMLPSWKGPAEVDRKILRGSGQLVMEGFRRGIEDERRSIEAALRSFTGGLPAAASPRARGGDGASLGSNSITIMPGAIVINGQGAQAGEEAASAVLRRLAQSTTVR